MLKDNSILGFWFLPGEEARAVPGTLEISADKGLALSLNGALAGGGFSNKEHQVVFGHTASGRLVTLYRCFALNINVSFPGYEVARYHVNGACVGEHLPEANDTLCRVFKVRICNLSEFIGAEGLSLRRTDDAVHASGEHRRAPVATVDGCIITAGYELVSSCEPMSEAIIRQNTFVQFDCDPPQSFRDFEKGVLRSVHTLMEFAVGGPLPLVSLSGFPTGRTSPVRDETTGEWLKADEVEMLFKQRTGERNRDPSMRHALPFTVVSLGDRWSTTFARWHNARLKFGPTFDHFFSLHRSQGMPVEHRFLSVVQALESFHRRKFPLQTREPPEHFRERKRRLTAALSKTDCRWLLNAIQWQNEPTLADRLRHLWEMMPLPVRQQLGSQDAFARDIVKARNYLTHYTPTRRTPLAEDPRRLFGSLMSLMLVLRIVFLLELDLDTEQVLSTSWGRRVLAESTSH